MSDVPSSADLRARATLLGALRGWFTEHGFLEIDVPVLVRSGALEEHLEALAVDGRFLHTSPEFALKRVLAAGLPRVYAITPCFRSEEHGRLHGTEFTMLEWYRTGVGYREIAEDLRGLLAVAASALDATLPPIDELTVAEAFARHAGGRPEDPLEAQRSWVGEVEPRLDRPTLVWDYPADEAAFACVRGDVAERFELYWRGVELANAFSELGDGDELLERWQTNNTARARAGRPPHPVDERLVDAVRQHPRAGGIAVGVDRLLAVLLERDDIHSLRVGG